jgi:hypothetical protein
MYIVIPPWEYMDSRWELRRCKGYEWELNKTSCILYGLLTGSHKSYGHYPHVESRDAYSDPASILYGFKVGTTSLEGVQVRI